MIPRRHFITLLGGAAAWPLAARAQQGDRVRRIGVLMGGDENDPEAKRRLSAFTQALAGLGWTDGRNARLDLRWGRTDINRMRALAQELVGLQPDIIVTPPTLSTRFYAAPNRPTSQSSSRPNWISSSTSSRPRRSASIPETLLATADEVIQ